MNLISKRIILSIAVLAIITSAFPLIANTVDQDENRDAAVHDSTLPVDLITINEQPDDLSRAKSGNQAGSAKQVGDNNFSHQAQYPAGYIASRNKRSRLGHSGGFSGLLKRLGRRGG